MAVCADPLVPHVVDLTELAATDLDSLLAEEIEVWRQRFHWDFRPSADLLRRFLQIRALSGRALRMGRNVIGYSYFVAEGHKGLIGDFYVARAYSSAAVDTQLLQAIVSAILQTSGIRRIESQLMLFGGPPGDPPSLGKKVGRYDRYFMEVNRSSIERLPQSVSLPHIQFCFWNERFMEEMAHLLVASYRGHIDGELNDQYRNVPGARQFLSNIIRYPGCGRFAAECSVLAIDAATGRLAGMCLASRVSEVAGHITQLCVLPALRSHGLGFDLIRRSLQKLIEGGSSAVSLTVTSTNVDAIRLYRALGFRAEATFPAMVWGRD